MQVIKQKKDVTKTIDLKFQFNKSVVLTEPENAYGGRRSEMDFIKKHKKLSIVISVFVTLLIVILLIPDPCVDYDRFDKTVRNIDKPLNLELGVIITGFGGDFPWWIRFNPKTLWRTDYSNERVQIGFPDASMTYKFKKGVHSIACIAQMIDGKVCYVKLYGLDDVETTLRTFRKKLKGEFSHLKVDIVILKAVRDGESVVR